MPQTELRTLGYPVPCQEVQGLVHSRGHRPFAVSVPEPRRATPNGLRRSVIPDLQVYEVVRVVVDSLLTLELTREHRLERCLTIAATLATQYVETNLAAVLQMLLVLVVAAAVVERGVADAPKSAAVSVHLRQSHILPGWREDSNSKVLTDSVSNQTLAGS